MSNSPRGLFCGGQPYPGENYTNSILLPIDATLETSIPGAVDAFSYEFRFEDGRRIYTCKRRDLDKLSSVNTLRVDIILQSKACSSTPLVSCLRFLYCEILSQVTTELFSLTCDSIFVTGHKLINIGTFNFLSIASDFPEI